MLSSGLPYPMSSFDDDGVADADAALLGLGLARQRCDEMPCFLIQRGANREKY